MHRSSKQRRLQLVRRWKRALFVAACTASFATSSFLFAQENTAGKKKFPTKAITPVKLAAVTRAASTDTSAANLAPIVRPEEAKRTSTAPETKLLGAKVSPFRPVAIQSVPAQTEERAPQLVAVPAPEVKAKPIPSKLKPVESQPEETVAPIVSASSIQNPASKPVEEMPAEVAAVERAAPEQEPVAPARPENLPVEGPSIFERAATPATTGSEAADAEVPAEEPPAQEPAPIVLAPRAAPLVQAAPEPKRLALPAKPLRAKPPARNESKSEPLVIAVQNEAAQPKAAQPADPLPAPDRDADLKKHFEVIQQSGEFSVQVHRSKLLRTAKD
ncbi:MAG: hypothetical protein ACKVP0_21630, partial [Pirellulaceae bacterium]